MRKFAIALILIGLLVGCGTAPEPTETLPTQTPWIIVVTATAGGGDVAEVLPTQTPWIIIATPTQTSKASPTVVKVTPSSAEPSTTPSSTTLASTPTPTSASSTAVPKPTDTLTPGALKYEAPELKDPPDGVLVESKGTVTLVWRSVGELADDEYYHVHFERPPKTEATPWYGDYVFTKDATLFVDQSFLAPFHLAEEHGSAEVYWWVRVVRMTGVDQNGKPLGEDVGMPSEKRFFVVEPRVSD